jgi:thiol-disulfide isomerase/thioredoxin
MRRRAFRSVGSFLFDILLVTILISNLAVPGYGQSAPDLTGKALDPFFEASGKIVVLVFLRTDCPISSRYAPVIQQLSRKYSGKATFWLVYPDAKTSASSIRKYMSDYGYVLRALRDPQHALVEQSHVQVTPEVAIFGGRSQLFYHGRIDNWYEAFGRSRPAPTTHELDDAIQAVLSGKPLATRVTDAVGCYISDL